MADQESWNCDASEETGCQSSEVPSSCADNCGFLGCSDSTNLSSKCCRKLVLNKDLVLASSCSLASIREQGKTVQTPANSQTTSLSDNSPSPRDAVSVFKEDLANNTALSYFSFTMSPECISAKTDGLTYNNGFSMVSLRADGPGVIHSSKKHTGNRCQACQKRVGLLGSKCRCGDLFCVIHRYSDKHACSFDYKAAGGTSCHQIRKGSIPYSTSPFKYFIGEVLRPRLQQDLQPSETAKRRQHVYNTMFHVPWRCELLIIVGFFVCLDSFLSLFTVVPLRIILFLWRVLAHKRKFQRPQADELVDFGSLLVVVAGVTLLQQADLSYIYHMIRSQATIKLYVVYNVLETLTSQSREVHNTMEFVPYAPACVVIRVLVPLYAAYLPGAPWWWLASAVFYCTVTYMILVMVKILVGIGLLKHANWYVERYKTREKYLHSD